jgi:hypothetical protein
MFCHNPCKKHITGQYYIKANSEAKNSNPKLAEEKAFNIAKAEILKQLDLYIIDNCSHQQFLIDNEYETKIEKIIENCHQNIVIVCSKTTKHRDTYSSCIAIEIPKAHINKQIADILNRK